MAPRNTHDFVEKKRKNKSKKNKLRKKWKICKSALNYGPYLCKVLKKQHPKLSLSIKSINILNSFGNDMLDRIAVEASILAKCNKHKTINTTEIQSAVRLVLPPGLAREATEFGIRAVVKYYQSKKGVNSRNALEMTEESDNREIWYKCFSKKKNMIYYWNSETKDSYWEEDVQKLLKRPNVEIHDKSEEMRNGNVPTFHPKPETTAKPQNGITTKSHLHIPLKSKTECEKEEDDDEDDDPDFNDSLNAFYESSHSSSSIFNGSQGSFTKYETSTGFERRHSEPLSKSNVVENSRDRRKSMEIPAIKAPTPKTCARPIAKPLTSCGKRSLSDTSSTSTSSRRPGLASETSVSQPKMTKKEIQKQLPRGRHKTPIQDRKMKEKEELLLKQKQKSSGNSTHSIPDIIAGGGGVTLPNSSDISLNNRQSLKNFIIPKRKVCNSTPDKESGKGSQADSQHMSPQQQMPTPPRMPSRMPQVPSGGQVPPQITGTMTSEPPNITQSVKRSSDSWVHTVWNTPPAVLVEAVDMPIPAPAPVTLHVPVQLPPVVTAPRPTILPTPSSERVKETVTTQSEDPSPVSQQNFRRKVKGLNSTKETTTTNLESSRVQETVTTQFKGPSPILPRNVRCKAKARNSAVTTSLASDRAQEAIASQFKGPSPILKRTVRGRNSTEKSNETKFHSDRAQEAIASQFKGPSPILKRTVRGRNSTEKSNETKFDSDRDSSFTRNGMKKKINDSDDSDSDSSDTANFKRTRISIETPSESTFATSIPTNRFALDTIGCSSTPVRRQSSVAGLSSAATGPSSVPSALGSSSFDARQVLERKRSMQSEMVNKPLCSNQDDSAMDWEVTEPAQESNSRNIQERLGQPSLADKHGTSLMMSSLKYKSLIIVCDTNALIHYIELVEELVDGTLLGISVTVVVPYQVFRELDGMKEHPVQDVMGGARAAIRLINGIIHSSCPSQYSFVLQSCTMHRKKAKNDFDLEKNDDFILNCALQEREAQGNDKIVILLTADKHLQVHAEMMGIISQCPTALKGWVREYKEKVRLQAMGMKVDSPQSYSISLTRQSDYQQPTETKMDVDPDPLLASSSTVSTSSSSAQTEKTVTNNCMKFYAESLTDDLLQFLNKVIDECNQREYADLKRFASQPRQSWTVIRCLGDVVRRWNTITEKRLSPAMNNNIRQIIELVKKYNKGKEEFTKSDMKTFFTCSQTLAREFVELYEDVSAAFLTRLNLLLEEWEQKSMSQSVSLCDEDDPQPADVALQNIYNCMRSDYATWKEVVEGETDADRKEELQGRLRAFHMRVTNMLRIIKGALEVYPQSSLTVDDECIFDFHKETTVFKAEDGNLLTFELTKENILALFKENNLRKGVEAMLDKIRMLQSDVWDLIEELSDSDSDDVFD